MQIGHVPLLHLADQTSTVVLRIWSRSRPALTPEGRLPLCAHDEAVLSSPLLLSTSIVCPRICSTSGIWTRNTAARPNPVADLHRDWAVCEEQRLELDPPGSWERTGMGGPVNWHGNRWCTVYSLYLQSQTTLTADASNSQYYLELRSVAAADTATYYCASNTVATPPHQVIVWCFLGHLSLQKVDFLFMLTMQWSFLFLFFLAPPLCPKDAWLPLFGKILARRWRVTNERAGVVKW
ncbi:hypothetical protein EYD10_18156 [Varanus komodoensis]|nr:hypothetical protein EYD10_18156 [Varanus komodoensis]